MPDNQAERLVNHGRKYSRRSAGKSVSAFRLYIDRSERFPRGLDGWKSGLRCKKEWFSRRPDDDGIK